MEAGNGVVYKPFESVAVAVTGVALGGSGVAGLATTATGRAFLAMLGIGAEAQSMADGAPPGGIPTVVVSWVKASSHAATFGNAVSSDYRATFFAANPSLQGQVIVHHAVERQALSRYPGVVTNAQMHSLENLRGIPKELNSTLHLSDIRKSWNQFYRKNPSPTGQDLLDQATRIDLMLGRQFNPPIH
jgi:hypothetical protein